MYLLSRRLAPATLGSYGHYRGKTKSVVNHVEQVMGNEYYSCSIKIFLGGMKKEFRITITDASFLLKFLIFLKKATNRTVSFYNRRTFAVAR